MRGILRLGEKWNQAFPIDDLFVVESEVLVGAEIVLRPHPGLLLKQRAALAGAFEKQVCWLIAGAVLSSQPLEFVHQRWEPERVGVVKWTASERRKTQTEHCAKISVGRRLQDGFCQATDRLVDKEQ